MIRGEKKYLVAEPIVAWSVFFLLLATYWSTVAPTVSFWDCPEYVTAARLLEIGHPPGNPVWMLVERMVTLFVPDRYAALAINLSSGLFTAFAGFFLAKTLFRVGLWVLLRLPRRHIPAPLSAAGGALVGALCFGWCDSVWYSAVEAEVYAMSLFMTSLCVWLMTKWAGTRSRGDSWRLLVLIAYLFGLSIGIHQLNLLCIPALAMVWGVRRGIRSPRKMGAILLLSLIAVACVLMGMMPSTISFAAEFEAFVVNRFGWRALSGVALYVATLGVSLIAALTAVGRSDNRIVMAIACFPSIFLSGIFIFSDHFLVGAIVSAVVALLLVVGANFKARRLYLAIWMLAMLLTGYSSYALIPIRGSIPSPANAAMPGEPFAFASYLNREQYGSKPLLYGPTPFARPLLREDTTPDGRPIYKYYDLEYLRPQRVPKETGARLKSMPAGITPQDSAENARLMARQGDAYIIRGMKSRQRKTPELNMWFPRITSSNPSDLRSYYEWIGMDSSTMKEVEISEAVTPDGRHVARKGPDGRRGHPTGLRPTYLQNAQWFATYQTGYMYWRYLLWNFAGRQNDRPSQGEVQHGNFITGFPAIDNAMLGAEDYLPPAAGSRNPGRNRYFLLPLLLGIVGMCWLMKSRRRGMQTCAVTAILFIMTGLAITVYLNQDPGEPRERDYSFLGSYMAWCVWIGFGAIMIARRFRSVWGFLLPLAIAGWMFVENYDDHDRSGRTAAREFGPALLNGLEPNAILFVNGDNYTFPLWYAQEVEGVRRDVRVVNLAYLNTPVYAANLMRDWRESKALPMTLRRGDIIWEAFRMTGQYNGLSADTIPAHEALEQLRTSDAPRFNVRYVTLPVGQDSSIVYDLRNLSAGKSVCDFGRLMMFDIVATNAYETVPRPIYWLGALGADKRIGLGEALSPWLFGYRYGPESEDSVDSLLLSQARLVPLPNPEGVGVYMDHAPSIQVAALRGAVTSAGERMLRAGRISEARELARKADTGMGDAPDSYGIVVIGDSTYNIRLHLAELLEATGDTLRARHHRTEYATRRAAWRLYRDKLPPRLRGKIAPTY